MSFFKSNIDSTGRILRGSFSFILLLLAFASWSYNVSPLLTLILLISSLFTAFEALKGWCIARACGIKTKF